MSTDFLAAEPPVAAPARPGARRRRTWSVLRWRRAATVRFTQVDLLDKVAPKRPRWRRHVVAVLMLLGLTFAVVATARPVERTTETTTSDGRILCCSTCRCR